jgi:hypothetical protein
MNDQNTKTPVRSRYGLYVGYCGNCKWQTIGSIRGNPPDSCEACGQKPEVKQDGVQRFCTEFRDDVAAVICTVAELRAERVRKFASEHKYMVVRVSPKRWACFRYDGVCSTFALKDDSAAWAYRSLEVELWNVDWQTLTQFIRKNTPELPKHLAR